ADASDADRQAAGAAPSRQGDARQMQDGPWPIEDRIAGTIQSLGRLAGRRRYQQCVEVAEERRQRRARQPYRAACRVIGLAAVREADCDALAQAGRKIVRSRDPLEAE